jgi:DNA-binding MarR family transcriptional regulator
MTGIGDGDSDPQGDSVHPATLLTETVHQRTRLGILAVLSECTRADFGYLKSVLKLTDGNLGRHLEILADEGLIQITKGYQGRRPRTWAEITDSGDAALAGQMAAMKDLVDQFEHRHAVQTVRSGVSKATSQPQRPRLSGA